jgi:hypothetical protein
VDYPFFTAEQTAAGLRAAVELAREARLPPLDEALVEELIERDGLALMGVA